MINSVHHSTAYEAIIHNAYDVKKNPTNINWEVLRASFTSYCYLYALSIAERNEILQHIADITVDGKCDERFEDYMLWLFV